MFLEFRDLISELKHKDHHFTRLFDKHNALDQEIKNMESGNPGASQFETEAKKKEKLALKDQQGSCANSLSSKINQVLVGSWIQT